MSVAMLKKYQIARQKYNRPKSHMRLSIQKKKEDIRVHIYLKIKNPIHLL